MILAPNEMKAEPDERKAGKICLETIKLDPDWYRIGHTKARNFINDPPTTIYKCFQSKMSEKILNDRSAMADYQKAVFVPSPQLKSFSKFKSDPVNRRQIDKSRSSSRRQHPEFFTIRYFGPELPPPKL